MADQYILGNVIGKGSYGEVTLATHKKDKKKFVIKTIDLHNASEKERLFAQQEVDILSKLRHPNIVSYKESFQTKEGYLAIVMGYCEGGDLYSRLKKQAKVGEYLSETQTVEWFVQIAMALQYMHDRNILHRDLKTQNVFLTKSKIIKLGDLGIARVLDNNVDMATTMIGTPYYMSPELFSNKPYNHKSDVWALGCCVYEMATLKHAFNARDMNSLVYKILKGKTPPMPKHYSTELQDIIKVMLNYDPMQRPSASRILRHSFIKKHIALFLEGTKNRRKSREEKVKKPVYDSGYSESSVEEKAIATASKIDIELESSGKIDKNAQKDKSVPEDSEQKSNVIKDEYSTKNNTNNNPKAYVKKPLKDKLKRIKKPPDREEKNESQPIETSEKNTSDNAIECEPRNSDGLPSRCNKQKSEKRKHEIRSRPLPPCPVQPFSQSTVPDKNRRNISSKKHEKHQVQSEKKNGDEIAEILPPPRFNRKADQRRAPTSEDSHRKDSDRGIPNMAARRKRREKQQELDSKIISPRVPVKKDSITSIVESHSPRPREEIVRAHIQRMSYNKDSIDCTDSVDGPNEHQEESEMCSPVERSETSVDEDEDILLSDNKNKNNEDVENLIDNLQATLKLDSSRPDSSRSPEQSSEEASESVISATGRLNDRISRLRRECTEALGEKILQKAYDIMDNQPEKNIEASLLSLLGRKNFNLYGGQIWQLKFCEEFQL